MSTQKIYRKLFKTIEANGPGTLQEFLRRRAYPGRGCVRPPIIVISMPKSGSIFLARSLCRVLQLQRGRFGSYGFTEPAVNPSAIRRIKAGNCVCQEHLPASDHVLASLSVLVPGIVVHVRDPRRALVSWIGHLNDLLEAGRLIDAYGFAERVMPEDYLQWDTERQMEWHVTHVLPRLVHWVEGWVRAHDDPVCKLRIALSTLEELQADQENTLHRLLDELGIPHRAEWLKQPGPRVGALNVRRDPSVDRKSKYPPALWERATAAVPAELRRRFNWS